MLVIILAKIKTVTLQIIAHSVSFRIRLLEEKPSYVDHSCYLKSFFFRHWHEINMYKEKCP